MRAMTEGDLLHRGALHVQLIGLGIGGGIAIGGAEKLQDDLASLEFLTA